MLSQPHNPPTNFLEICKALETLCHLFLSLPSTSSWSRCLGGTEEVLVVFFPEGNCCWIPHISTERTVQPAPRYCRPEPALEGWVAMHNLSPVCGEG